jgi:putative membrane protein
MPTPMHTVAESRELAAGLTLIFVFAGVVYLRGWRYLRSTSSNSIAAWRAISFFLGILFAWVAVASPIASFDERMLTGHMIQHLMLMTFAPPLIWLGEPVRAFDYAVPKARSLFRRPSVQQLERVIGHPAFCWLAAAAALVAWHVPSLLRLGMQTQTWHLVEQGSFLATGLLFWWPVVQPWPGVARWPRWCMLLYLFLATLPCDVLSGLLVFSDRVAYPMYLCTPRQSGLSALEDQQCAAALMWTSVTVVFLVAGTVLSMQLLSPRGSGEDGVAQDGRPQIAEAM